MLAALDNDRAIGMRVARDIERCVAIALAG